MKTKTLGLALAVLGLFASYANAESYPLYAGQNIEVGTVDVTYIGNHVAVTYQLSEPGWVLTETHTQVVCNLVGVPQSKGNPVPGKFEDSETFNFDDGIVTYTFEDDVACSGSVVVAAHAVVKKEIEPAEQLTENFASDLTWSNAVYAWEPGPAYPNDGADDSSWAANSLWDNNIDHAFSSNADWIWSSYRVVHPLTGDIATFSKVFNINGAVDAAEMHITCDNGYEVNVNGQKACDAQVYGNWKTSDLTETFVSTSGWQSVESCDIVPYLVSGANTIEIVAANEQLDGGTLSSNPGGCIFEGSITYTDPAVIQSETAWGDGGMDFIGKNWATYISHSLDCLDLSGDWTLLYLGTWNHDVSLEQNGCTLSGTGGYPAGSADYSTDETLDGSATASGIVLHSVYDGSNPLYQYTATGALQVGGTISGNLVASNGQGGFVMTRAT